MKMKGQSKQLYLDRQAMDVIVYVLIYKKTEYKQKKTKTEMRDCLWQE